MSINCQEAKEVIKKEIELLTSLENEFKKTNINETALMILVSSLAHGIEKIQDKKDVKEMSKIVADLCYFSITLITIFSLLLGVKPNLISLEDIVKFVKSICGFKSRVMENNDLFWEQFLSSSSSNNIHEA